VSVCVCVCVVRERERERVCICVYVKLGSHSREELDLYIQSRFHHCQCDCVFMHVRCLITCIAKLLVGKQARLPPQGRQAALRIIVSALNHAFIQLFVSPSPLMAVKLVW